MSDKCARLHELIHSLKRYKFSNYNKYKSEIPECGIHVLFEEGEKGHQGRRIVWIGEAMQLDKIIYSHIACVNDGGLKDRRYGSRFQKNINSALSELSKLSGSVYKQQPSREYIKKNVAFSAFEIADKEDRSKFKAKIIATVAQCKDCKPSVNWLGRNSDKKKVREIGLWQEQHIDDELLNAEDFTNLSKLILEPAVRALDYTSFSEWSKKISSSSYHLDKTIVRHERHEMVKDTLADQLSKKHGEKIVKKEYPTKSGTRVDVAVLIPNKYKFYEVKIADSSRECIRQAIGQLLEYSYWPKPKHQEAAHLIIVGEPKLDAAGCLYIEELRKRFDLPLEYKSI